MQKRTRSILFWIAVVTFLVASWVVIRYAQGYAYDFEVGKFVRTGALAVTVNTSATFSINGVRTGDTSLLGNRAGQEGLTPGNYGIQVSREGYTVWHKSTLVEEGRLTDFPHVLILPIDDSALMALKEEASKSLRNAHVVGGIKSKEIRDGDFMLRQTSLLDMRTASPSLLAENVLGFSVAEDQSRLLWWTRNEVWVIWLRNTDQQPYRTEDERLAITRFSIPITRAAWFRDLDHIVVDLGNQSYRILETDTRGGTNIIKL